MNKLLLKNALVYRDRAFCPAERLSAPGWLLPAREPSTAAAKDWFPALSTFIPTAPQAWT